MKLVAALIVAVIAFAIVAAFYFFPQITGEAMSVISAPPCFDYDKAKAYNKSSLTFYGTFSEVKGPKVAKGKIYYDTCVNDRTLIEYYCNKNIITSETHQCDSNERCIATACVPKEIMVRFTCLTRGAEGETHHPPIDGTCDPAYLPPDFNISDCNCILFDNNTHAKWNCGGNTYTTNCGGVCNPGDTIIAEHGTCTCFDSDPAGETGGSPFIKGVLMTTNTPTIDLCYSEPGCDNCMKQFGCRSAQAGPVCQQIGMICSDGKCVKQ